MQPLAQPPETKESGLTRWLFLLWRRINSTAGLAWSVVDKTGSNLTDIETRNHADLQNINTANYTHLTATNHTDLTDGGVTALHQHDFSTVVYPAASKIGAPTHIDSLEEVNNHQWSSGVVDGCDLTDNGDGTISIAAGVAVIRGTADAHTTLYAAEVPAQANISLTDNATNYVYLDYNAGSPQFVASTSITSFNCMDKCIAYMVHRSGTTLHWIDAREQNVDGNRKMRQLFLKFSRFIHSEGGSVLGANGLAVTVTSGSFYFMLQEQTHDAFDTSVAGTANVNVFTLWNHVAGVYTSTANSKTIDTTLYDDGTNTATLGNNKYGVTWFYIVNDEPSELHAVMGQAEYANLADAEVASPPSSVPGIISGLGSLIGYVIYEKSAVAFDDVRSAFAQRFTSSTATPHNGLSGLQGGTTDEYYHATSAEYTGTGTGVFVRATAPTISAPVISGGSIDDAAIGATTPDTAKVTTLETTGAIGVGTAPISQQAIRVSTTLSGSTTQMAFNWLGVWGSAATTTYGINIGGTIDGATVNNHYSLAVNNPSILNSATVSSCYGIIVSDITRGSVVNIGVRSQLTSGTGKWNFYASGTANNAFAGNVRIGSVVAPTVALDVTGTIQATNIENTPIGVSTPGSGAFTTLSATGNVTLGDASTDTVRINGYLGIGAAPVSSSAIYATKTATDANNYGLQSLTQSNFSTAGTYYLVGSQVLIYGNPSADYIGVNNTGYVRGGDITAFMRNDYGTLTELTGQLVAYGNYGLAGADLTGTITTAAGVRILPFNVASATITSLYGVRVQNTTTGTITNKYGVASEIASGTNYWNFYASGTANNAFNGNTRFGGTTAPTVAVDVTGAVLATTTILSSGATSGIGYTTGAGGTVTQATSRTTGVTLNKVSGAITLVSSAGSTSWQSFTVTNSAVAATDTVIVNQKSGTDLYMIHVTAVGAGSFQITYATTGGTTTEQPVFNFNVIKGVAA